MIKKKRFGVIFLIVFFAAIGFWTTPTLAKALDSDGLPITGEAVEVPEVTGEGEVVISVPGEEAFEPGEEVAPDESFGQNTQATFIGAADFENLEISANTRYDYSFGGAWRFASASGWDGLFAAPVRLPSGVRVTAIRFYLYDSDANGGYDINVKFVRESFPTGRTTLFNFTTATGAGYYTLDGAQSHYVTNANTWYQVLIDLPTASTSNVRFWGCRLLWHRVIWYPTSQIFNDVPPSGTWSWAYPSIQALSASGITQGCPDCVGCFCPSKPVSRAAMATFLARALGLYAPFSAGF